MIPLSVAPIRGSAADCVVVTRYGALRPVR
jgi:hypothetical protein